MGKNIRDFYKVRKNTVGNIKTDTNPYLFSVTRECGESNNDNKDTYKIFAIESFFENVSDNTDTSFKSFNIAFNDCGDIGEENILKYISISTTDFTNLTNIDDDTYYIYNLNTLTQRKTISQSSDHFYSRHSDVEKISFKQEVLPGKYIFQGEGAVLGFRSSISPAISTTDNRRDFFFTKTKNDDIEINNTYLSERYTSLSSNSDDIFYNNEYTFENAVQLLNPEFLNEAYDNNVIEELDLSNITSINGTPDNYLRFSNTLEEANSLEKKYLYSNELLEKITNIKADKNPEDENENIINLTSLGSDKVITVDKNTNIFSIENSDFNEYTEDEYTSPSFGFGLKEKNIIYSEYGDHGVLFLNNTDNIIISIDLIREGD